MVTKEKPPSYFDYRRLLILCLVSIALSLVVTVRNPQSNIEYQLGDVARENVKSPMNFTVPDTDMTVKKGEIIIREGDRINEESLQRLAAMEKFAKRDFFSVKKFISLFVLLFAFIGIIFEYAGRNIKKFTLTKKDLLFSSLFTIFSTLIVKTCFIIFQRYAPEDMTNLFYIIPIFLFGIVFRTVLFSEASIVFSAIFSIIMSFVFDGSLAVFLYAFIGNVLSSHFAGKCESRNIILKAGLYSALMMGALMIVFDLFLGRSLNDLPLRIGFVLLNGVASSFIALGILPVVESLFDYTTDIKLLELANFEHPLLGEMMVDAPGTYHHSVVVGNLAKAAAESIGAHPLLARVAAYYHDIGKLKMPHYYIENRTDPGDAHKDLTPNMSALIILSHVKEGVEMADEYKIGRKIKEIIQQHHGTTLVSFFYTKAKEMEDQDLHVIQDSDFRYGGPKPQTKEAGIVMLADAVEAASRVLDDPTPKRIESHVQDIVENIFLDGQLDECELTLKDLHAIQRSFTTLLIGVFHQRIEYPERTQDGGTDKKFPKAVDDKHKEHQKGHRGLANLFGVSR